tara:strand:+ start:82 stop:717 length:636 start_codon:yes stop_codon:yes gene_type:complete
MSDIIYQQFDKILAPPLLVIFSLIIRYVLILIGQRWISTISHTVTLVFLPLIVYVITKVIAGNIALSLGMVGALSIVRFRNPVRSPLELTMYFAAITMGIAASVDLRWLYYLFGTLVVSSIIFLMLHFFWKIILKKRFFNISFSEGNSLSTLDLVTSGEILDLDNSQYLAIKESSEGNINYVLSSSNFEELKKVLSRLKGNKDLISFQLKQ